MTQHPPIMHVISLGAGVQSTTMALMAAHGEIEPMPDAAIFADTGAEPKAVYEHLDWLRSPGVLPFPVEVVQFSDLTQDIRKTAAGVKPVAGRANGYLAPPLFTVNADGSHGMLRCECTSNYKIKPILYGWKEGTNHYWCGARDQGDVWFVDKPARNDLHPTMKPVVLVERALRNSSKSRDVVLDPFAGSGSTVTPVPAPLARGSALSTPVDTAAPGCTGLGRRHEGAG